MKKAAAVLAMILIFIFGIDCAKSLAQSVDKKMSIAIDGDLKNHIDMVFVVGRNQSENHSWVILGHGFIIGDDTVVLFKSFFDFMDTNNYNQLGVGVIDSHSETLIIKDVLPIKKIIIGQSYLKLKISGHLSSYW